MLCDVVWWFVCCCLCCVCASRVYHVKYVFVCLGDSLCDVIGCCDCERFNVMLYGLFVSAVLDVCVVCCWCVM